MELIGHPRSPLLYPNLLHRWESLTSVMDQWGGFSREPFDENSYTLPAWAIVPFTKYAVITADDKISYEAGYTAQAPHKHISPFGDTIFFTGMTDWNGQHYAYYGGREYYTCLATT